MSGRDLDAASVYAQLKLSEDFIPWLDELETIGPPTPPVSLPAAHEVSDLLTHLHVSPEDAAEIIEAWPEPDQAPEVWWLLQRCYQQLVTQMGDPYPSPRRHWPLLPSHLGATGRLFYIYVFLAAFPAIRRWHQQHGIAEEVSWATLADLGENVAIYRRMFGVTGLDVPFWLALHFRGVIYRLGRLQFERWRVSSRWPITNDAADNVMPGSRPFPGDPALSVHIPESGGPLQPAICDASFGYARDFFGRHFPEQPYRFARCASWLLDPQLADYLPPHSNIVRFQRRFQLVPGGSECDEDVIRFVFRRVAPSLDELPQRTTLERVVVEHLRAGRHWQLRSGWVAL